MNICPNCNSSDVVLSLRNVDEEAGVWQVCRKCQFEIQVGGAVGLQQEVAAKGLQQFFPELGPAQTNAPRPKRKHRRRSSKK